MTGQIRVYDPTSVLQIAQDNLAASNPLHSVLDNAVLRKRLARQVILYCWMRADPRQFSEAPEGEVTKIRRLTRVVGRMIDSVEDIEEELWILEQMVGTKNTPPYVDDLAVSAKNSLLDLYQRILDISADRKVNPYGSERTGPDPNSRKISIERLASVLAESFIAVGAQVPCEDLYSAISALINPMNGTDSSGRIPNERSLRKFISEKYR